MKHAGKLGPWARAGAKGTRFLDVGSQGAPAYRQITSVVKHGETWRYISVTVAHGENVWETRSCGSGTNIYEEVR